MFSAFLCILMVSGLVVPLMMTNTSNRMELTTPVEILELSEASEVWFHDGTNLTGFTDISDSSWFYPFNSSDTIVSGDIGVGTSWIRANDVGSGSGWHGPVKSIPLSDPFKISELVRFDARIGFDSSVGSQLGGIRVMLHDSNQRVISQFNIFDSWADDKQLKMPVHWAFLNGSYTGTPWSEPDWVTFAPYDETLTILQNSTGFYTIIPEIGNFRLNVGPNDDLDRVVSYVSVWFAGNDGYSFCDSVYLHSLSLEWAPQQGVSDFPISWHDDATNTSQFTQYMDWNMDWWFEDYLVTTGDMTSDGDAYSFSNIPAASSPVRWHGPIYAHNLSQPFMLSDFQELSVHFDVDNTLGSYSGIISVYLCDEDFVPAIEVFLSDSWNSQSYGHNRAHYRYNNLTYVTHGDVDYISWTTFNDTISIWSNATGDLLADVPGFGTDLLLLSEDVESSREIKYVVVQASRLAGYTWMPSEVLDINLEYEVSTPTTDNLTIDSPDDILFDYSSTGHNITWSPSSTLPFSYELYVDGELADSGTWNGSQFVIDLDELGPGIYNYTLCVSNTIGATVYDEVLVTVTSLTIDSPDDILFDYGSTGHNITWSPSSTLPSSYELYIDGELAESGSWDGSQFVIDLDELTPGIYNYTLCVSNTLMETAYDEVIVVVTGQSPSGNLTVIAISIGFSVVIVIIIGVICRGRNRGLPTSPSS